jgi:nitrite reductase/ring-hydroxylating ferredoxin subunit
MTTLRRTIAMTTVLAMLTVVALIALSPKAGADQRGNQKTPTVTGDSAAFSWLRPGTRPSAWTTLRLPGSPARLSAPPGWQEAGGDTGTRTMVLRRSGRIVGYLNATPHQGDETAADWSRFRVAHNREEGDRENRLVAAAAGLRFHDATGACVVDAYTTITGNRFREIACIVSGRSATTVIVAAAPPSRWATEAPLLERAVSYFTT